MTDTYWQKKCVRPSYQVWVIENVSILQPESRLSELKNKLIARDYKKSFVNAAIVQIPRSEAIKRVVRNNDKERVVFSIKYDPRLPSLANIVKKHHRTMIEEDPCLKEVLKHPPLVAYKRNRNLKDFLFRSKVPKQTRPKRKINVKEGK